MESDDPLPELWREYDAAVNQDYLALGRDPKKMDGVLARRQWLFEAILDEIYYQKTRSRRKVA